MKVRIGYSSGARAFAHGGDGFARLVDALEGNGFDSLWCSERATAPVPDPMSALAFAAGRTRKLKLGTSVQTLPGRSPVLLAKEWATLDVLSDGRALPAFGLGATDPREQRAFGIDPDERVGWLEEALPLMRRLWSEDSVDHEGPRFHYEGMTIGIRPAQAPLDVWLGGLAQGAQRRIGRLADGWLPSFITPSEFAVGRQAIEESAASCGRTIDPEHYGTMVVFRDAPLTDQEAAFMDQALRVADMRAVVVVGKEALRERIEAFLDVGCSKFVLSPMYVPDSWSDAIDALAADVLDLQGTR
jgi:probable F420-dependent oxidoreductase